MCLHYFFVNLKKTAFPLGLLFEHHYLCKDLIYLKKFLFINFGETYHDEHFLGIIAEIHREFLKTINAFEKPDQ